MLHFEGTPILHTARLVLRPYRMTDAEAIYRGWAADPCVTQYLPWQPHQSPGETAEQLESWVKGYLLEDYLRWGITREGTLIGDLALVGYSERNGEGRLGYCLAREAWGQGIMTEAVRNASDYLFEVVGFHRLSIRHALPNVGSGRVAEKCGFTREGVERRAFPAHNGEYLDIVCWGKLREEWRDGA